MTRFRSSFTWEQFTLLGVLITALLFGCASIANFETTDEHFWKYERIPQYWHALADGNLKKTAINDKPGVSVALVSGMGLLFVDPALHRVRDPAITQEGALTVYDATLTEKLNWALRLPILLFNLALLVLGYCILKKLFPESFIPLITTAVLALTPATLGMSQIINPDALLWSTGYITVLSWLAFLRHRERYWIFVASIFLGLALLSKYTANILFPVAFALSCGYPFFSSDWKSNFTSLTHYLRQTLLGFVLLVLGSTALFSIGMPAVFSKPQKLWDGIFGFWLQQHFLRPLIGVLFMIAIDTVLFHNRGIRFLMQWWQRLWAGHTRLMFIVPVLFFGAMFVFSSGQQSWIPLNTLIETAKEDGSLAFPLLSQWPASLAAIAQVMAAAYPFVVSHHPILFVTLLLGWIFFTRSAASRDSWTSFLMLFIGWFSMAYFAASVAAGVLPNVRYSILLYPLFALAVGITQDILGHAVPEKFRTPFFRMSTAMLLLILLLSLVSSKPFYLNASSPLVSKTFAPHDAWGYGQYEAAQFLNQLPKSEHLLIWSDRNGICQFLTGPRCISGYKIDLSQTVPDYFVVSKRGIERGYVPRDKQTNASLLTPEVLGATPVWRLDILNRPDNFIKIIPAQLNR